MRTLINLMVLILLNPLLSQAFAAAGSATDSQPNKTLIRIVIMPYKLVGDLGNAEIDSHHKQRLAMANATLREKLQQTKQYEMIDEATSADFASKVTAALGNNDCNKCESTLAKELNAKQIIVPWVYRLSQLVLTMHFVVIDADSGKIILKKALDFRGDNDQSWQRAIKYFVENIKSP